MKKDVLHTIKENMTRFSKGQKRIADYILSDYELADGFCRLFRSLLFSFLHYSTCRY